MNSGDPYRPDTVLFADLGSILSEGERQATPDDLDAIVMLLGALPTWPHSQGWGYYPSGGLGLVVLILVVLMLSGRL